MAEENFDSLIPQRGDSADIVRVKQAHAAARLIEPAVMSPVILEISVEQQGSFDWQPVVGDPLYFRKALVWGADLDGQTNTNPVRLRFGTNANRTVNPGSMIAIQAQTGQKLNLQELSFMPNYGSDMLTFELY